MSETSTSQPIRFAILGTAAIATKVGKGIQQAANASLDLIASRDLAKAQAWAETHGVPRAVASYDAALADPDIDAVYIPLPNSLHYDWTLKAAAAGKHVLCEKPIAANADRTREMIAACQQHQVQFMDCTMWMHHDRQFEMKAQLQRLGKLRRLTSAFTFCWDEIPTANIRLQPELAGGSLGDLGWYCARAILWAFREQPTQVWATARWFNQVDMNLSAVLWFRDDKMASFDCGFDTVMRQWLEVAGTHGALVCDDFVLPREESESRFFIHDAQQQVTRHTIGPCHQIVRMVENFARLAASGKPDPSWPELSLQTQILIDHIIQAARTEQIVTIPSDRT